MVPLFNILNKPGISLQPWQVFSSDSLWPDMRIELYRFPPMYQPEHTSEAHRLIFNCGAPVIFASKSESRWEKTQCHNGSVLQLISPGAVSEMQWENELHALYLCFDGSSIDQLTETENFRFKEQKNFTDPILADRLFKIREEITNGHIVEKVYLQSLVLSCVIHLASAYAANGKKVFTLKGKLSARQFKDVIDYTRSSIHANISLTQLASCANLSPFHFARLFRQTAGVSPYQFVLQMKIEYAKKLIKQHSGSISDVAYVLNFTDQAHFSNAFKKVTGICPRQFLQTNAA
jgi:AraC family transcriptional regulator